MNIIILSDRYHPTPVSGAVLTYDLARELVEQNHRVLVLTADSNIDINHKLMTENGIDILRVKTQNQKTLNKPSRLLFELLLQRKIWKAFMEYNTGINYNLVIAHSPTIFWGNILKKLTNKYSGISKYLILRDIFPKWALDTGIISRFNPIYWFLKWHELKLYREVDKIGVQSNSNLNYFEKATKPSSIEVLYNFKKPYLSNIPKSKIREKLELQDKVIFVFGGNLGFAQDIDNLLRLVGSFRNDDKFHFLFIGEGTEFKSIDLWIKNNDVKNITLLPAVSDLEYQSILQVCDVGVISLRRSFKTDNFPNKIMNYMEYKLPILASINPNNELSGLINEHGIGLVSENGDDKGLKNNTLRLLEDSKLRSEMGSKGKILLEKQFNANSAVTKILSNF